MKNDYTQLHLHTSYSLSDSTINIDKLIKLAKKQKIKSLAITDRMNMFAAIKFYQKCIDNKIKPIIGCEIPLKDKYSKKQQQKLNHLLLDLAAHPMTNVCSSQTLI